MRKSYKYRIYPTKKVSYLLSHQFELCRKLYNCALEHRITAYKTANKYISYFDQSAELKSIKELFPEYKEIFAQCLQQVLKTLDKAYQSFFRRIKSGEKPGFPRFKGKNRFDSICFPQYPSGCKLEGQYLIISRVGKIKVKYHRKIIGTVKTVTIKRTSSNKFYVIFSCNDVPVRLLPKTNMICSIDVGIKSFLVTSGNEIIPNPKFFDKSKSLLEKRQQRLSKAKKGTSKRNKLRLLVAKTHEHISNQRHDFHFKTANKLVKQYDTIFVEDLNIKQMTNSNHTTLNRHIADCSWSNFLNILSFKAVEAGKEVVKVNPKNTTQACSNCGTIVPKDLSVRIHNCPVCHLSIDRDHNSALNILRLGMSRLDNFSLHPEKPPAFS